ncbi:alpha/beta hydrolase-fold protein [Flavobacterium oreochromis]|uniref:Alpha/beta hydrolase-fold protein n=1 Tax=Flavobacterium oreochromis TaxID=2906078 RepID=A0ABW8P4C0_9FLAO|nr:alpha/beta hydrolase-fold protein [Flavobacterium oreochromis]OWP78692.1 histidine kinase [Flavobacterium oreochromis]
MKNFIWAFAFFCSLTLSSQTTVDHFFSAKLNTKRDITVKLPTSYGSNPERAYPMILVLDADFLFSSFESTLKYGNYWDDLPEVILVGINQNKNNERYDDSQFDPAEGLPSKTGANFFEFIGTELLPHLEKKYRIAPFRIIAGMDVTAGFLNAYLYKENPIFDGYISISPELANGMEGMVAQRLSETKKPIFYYQATSDGDLKKFQKNIRTLNQNIQTIKNDLLNYKFDDFKGLAHYGIAPNAIPSALYHFFGIYQPITAMEYQDKISLLKEGFVDYLNKKYEVIEKSLGVKTNIRFSDMKAIETVIKKNEAWYEYELLAQISGQQYEKTMLYEYHMGMYWEKRGEIKKALKFYQDSFNKLEIGDITKDFMMNKAEELKAKLPKKNKMKGGKAKDTKTEENSLETPSETSTEPVKEENKKEN